jgi:hypothetical protein
MQHVAPKKPSEEIKLISDVVADSPHKVTCQSQSILISMIWMTIFPEAVKKYLHFLIDRNSYFSGQIFDTWISYIRC